MAPVINRSPSPIVASVAGDVILPEPIFDDWDPTPHGHYVVGVLDVQLGDVVLGTHQVEGIGQAEQRGAPARRLDLSYVVGPSTQATARVILPLDQQLRVKRYHPTPGHDFAYVELRDNEGSVPPGLIPDYGRETTSCCAPGIEHPDGGRNPHGYEVGQTMCDDCAGDWAIDYKVVRHNA